MPADPPVDPLLEEALAALDEGDLAGALHAARRGAARARKAGDAALRSDFLWVEGAALLDDGDAGGALAALDEALALEPDHLDARLERARALFERCRFEEAREAAAEVLDRAPDEPGAHHLLGLLAERRGDEKGAARSFKRARALDPRGYPAPVAVSREAFQAIAEAEFAAIPEAVRRHLANVPVTVEDLPSDDDLAGDPPLSPGSLGLFRGAPYGQKGGTDPWSQLPSAIVLFQRNLERAVTTREALEEEIHVTLVHEIGHFLGLDEEELWARGLG
jgi:predicted Zn-dependent protease with MMP-like domain/Flp pilus assembly protein TadD